MIIMDKKMVKMVMKILRAREKEFKTNDLTLDYGIAYGNAADLLQYAIEGKEKPLEREAATYLSKEK